MKEGVKGDGTSTTASEFKKMSQADKDWLTMVMKEGLVDLVKRAGELVDQIKDDALAPARAGLFIGDEATETLVCAIEELQDICEQIDFAKSLVQIGGVPPLLETLHPSLAAAVPARVRGACFGVLATVAQNNPFAQQAFLNLGVLPLATAVLLAPDSPPSLQVKALHCLSCVVRNFEWCEAAFFAGASAHQAAKAAAAAAAALPELEAAAAAAAAAAALPELEAAAAAAEAPKPMFPRKLAAGPEPLPARPTPHFYFDLQGVFVEEVAASGAPAYALGPAAALPGPAVLGACLASGNDPRLQKKAAFFLHALCCTLASAAAADDGAPQPASPAVAAAKAGAYFAACGHALAALVLPALPLPPPPPSSAAAPNDRGGESGGDESAAAAAAGVAAAAAAAAGQAVDLRETALKCLISLANAGAARPLAAAHGEAFVAARERAAVTAAALAVVAASGDASEGDAADAAANAAAEEALWSELVAALAGASGPEAVGP
jgi:hypothetical protein